MAKNRAKYVPGAVFIFNRLKYYRKFLFVGASSKPTNRIYTASIIFYVIFRAYISIFFILALHILIECSVYKFVFHQHENGYTKLRFQRLFFSARFIPLPMVLFQRIQRISESNRNKNKKVYNNNNAWIADDSHSAKLGIGHDRFNETVFHRDNEYFHEILYSYSLISSSYSMLIISFYFLLLIFKRNYHLSMLPQIINCQSVLKCNADGTVNKNKNWNIHTQNHHHAIFGFCNFVFWQHCAHAEAKRRNAIIFEDKQKKMKIITETKIKRVLKDSLKRWIFS